MLPVLSSPHIADGPNRDPEVCRERAKAFVGMANRLNLFSGQPCPVVTFARQAVATLREHVPHIVAVGAEEQMVRSHAVRRVALVQDPQPVGNRTVGQFPRHAMGVRVSLSAAASADIAVPAARRAARPEPAPEQVIGAVNEAREPRGERFRLIGSHGDLQRRLVRAAAVLMTPWRPAYFMLLTDS